MFGIFKKGNKTVITTVNITLQGHTHQIEGIESDKDKIELKIPFRNKIHSDMLTDAGVFKTVKGKPLDIKGIKAADPFTLISVEPKPPLVINPDELVSFKVLLAAPPHNYTGPLKLNFETASEEVIHIELTKTFLNYNGKKREIESSSRMLNLHKNGIFVEKVQMYKALSSGSTVSKAEVGFPFKLVNTDPKLPALLDTPNGYIMSFYIQAPEQNYSGSLEISVT